MKSAVLVIDVQQGLCTGDGAAFDCAATIDRINAVTRKARLAKVPVIFVQHESAPGYLEHGTPEWQLAEGLDVQPGDVKQRKTTPDAFLRTDLEAILRSDGVERLIVCGMHSEFCIDSTTRRALSLGFPVVLVSDGHTSAGNGAISAQQVIAHENATLTNISSFGPRATAVASAEVEIAGSRGDAADCDRQVDLMTSPRISTALEEQDINVIHGFLANESAWASGIPIEVVREAVKNSLNFGVFIERNQVAYARVVTDCATFAYLVDVFVLEAHRGNGYSRLLMASFMSHPRLQGLRRFMLATSTAHGLYEKFGFTAPVKPNTLMERFAANAYQREV